MPCGRRVAVSPDLHRTVRAVSLSPAMTTVLEALAGATAAGVAEALKSNDSETAIAAAKAALHDAERRVADARGAAKFPEFRSE